VSSGRHDLGAADVTLHGAGLRVGLGEHATVGRHDGNAQLGRVREPLHRLGEGLAR